MQRNAQPILLAPEFQDNICIDTHLGGMTVCWNGLCMAEAILAMSLLHATPAEHVYPAHAM